MPRKRPLSRRRPPSAPILIGLCTLAPALTACTGVEPAVLGAGATAAESGVTFFEKGKVTTFEPVPYREAVEAARFVAQSLQLQIAVDEPGVDDELNRRHRFSLRDERGVSIVLIVDRRTAAITRLHADVGTFGPTSLAGLVVNKTLERLKQTGAYDRTGPDPLPERPYHSGESEMH
jgi:hypothetical protein